MSEPRTEIDARCDDCGHVHTDQGCTGDPTASDLWAGVSPASCDCADGADYWITAAFTDPPIDLNDADDDCGCVVSHPRWCAWNGPCCDSCSHGADEAHAECCRVTIPPGQQATA